MSGTVRSRLAAKRIRRLRWSNARWLTLALLALLSASACDLLDDDSGKKKDDEIELGAYTETHELNPKSVTSNTSGAVDVVANVPDDSQSMGIVVIGTDTEWKFIEHGGLLLGQDDDIRGPDGAVPLSFNIIDDVNSPSAVNNQAAAVHFPNDGSNVTLPEGKYRFPVGAACDDDSSTACSGGAGALYADTLEPIVYYKTATSQQAVLRLNVVVLAGVSPAIGDATAAAADAEVEGAIAVLRNVYERKSVTELDVQITVVYSIGCGYDASADVIDDQAEFFCLVSSYPALPTDDAMNIFIVTSFGYLPAGVIGLAAGIPGPFNIQGLAVSGTVAEYQSDATGTILGFTLAHEFGHFLGLFHTSQTNEEADGIIGFDPIADTDICTNKQIRKSGSIDNCSDRSNLMFPYVDDNDDPDLSTGQGNVVRYNPAVTP